MKRQLSARYVKPMRVIKWLALILGAVLICTQSVTAQTTRLAAAPRCDWSNQGYTDFYQPPALGVLTPDRLGEIWRVEPIGSYTRAEVPRAADLPSSPYAAIAYRILYLSQGPLGVPQAVSGLIVVPIGSKPAAGFPILVHGHATTGMADVCAPSKYTISIQTLLPWIAQGYFVTAPDYTGLGTPGLHPYGIGEAAGYNLLDGARAAQQFCDSSRNITVTAGNQIILEGYSQGGQSALFAQQIQPTYAPQLNLVGTVTFAPGSELRFPAQQTAGEQYSTRITALALAMYAYSQYYDVPNQLTAWLKEPYATELPARAEDQCGAGIATWLGFWPEQVFQPALLTAVQNGEWDALQPWTGYLDANTPGNFTSSAPVLILHGNQDSMLPVEGSVKLTQRLCAHGTSATLSRYADADHLNIVARARSEAVTWIQDRLANQPMTDSCSASTTIFLPMLIK